MLDLEDLQTFVEVADTGGVTQAARRLGLAKSVVSRRLVRLERELGAQLLSRTTRGAALTEAGASFREHAARIAAEFEAVREAVAPEGDVQGRLRISAPLSFGLKHLAPVLAELAQRHPKLQVHASYSDRFVDLIGEGFDAAVRIGYLADSNLVARRIAPIRARFVASPAYIAQHGRPMTPDDLVRHQVVAQANETWRINVDGKTVTLRPQSRFTADNGAAIVAAALAGIGMSMMPEFLCDEHIASGALVPLLDDYPIPEAGLHVVRPPGDYPPRKVRVLIDIMLERFGKQ